MRTREQRTPRYGEVRQQPEQLGWSAADLRSAYAVDGSGPFLYAPDGAGPFSYERDGSGPFLVGPDSPARYAPRVLTPRGRRRRIGAVVASGAFALAVAVGSVGVVAIHPAAVLAHL